MRVFFGSQHLFSIFFSTLATLWSIQASPRTDPPMVPHDHFLFMWNAPTRRCGSHFKIPLDLSLFPIVTSTMKTDLNQTITLFYTDRFGIFPHIETVKDTDTFITHKGGVPQVIDMKLHLKAATEDINYYIPSNQSGWGVLDFEEWRPLWDRNWSPKDIYRKYSMSLVKDKNPSLSEKELWNAAKAEFQHGAQTYFLESMRLGQRMRPNRLWGYYLFPECYNYHYKKEGVVYNGECPDIEKKRNDELIWLWNESTALYPSIYLVEYLRDSQKARQFVRHRMLESLRVSTLPNKNYSIPIYPYIRPAFKDTKTSNENDYMSELDLVNTIGEAAALGAAGVISWGDMNVASNELTCALAQNHLVNVMNPYILNITTAARHCSRALCQNNGRCVRKTWDEDVYLHLDPKRYQIQRDHIGDPWTVKGTLSQDDISWFSRHFDCMCYSEEPCYKILAVNSDWRMGGVKLSLLLLTTTITMILLFVLMYIAKTRILH